jgi:L-ascorbate 6-phosphate lactonase
MPSLIRAILILVAAAGLSPAAGDKILDYLRSQRDGISVVCVGNAGWVIHANGLLIGIDLDLSTPNKLQEAPVSADVLAPQLDVAFVSHHHGDHCNVPTIRTLAERGKATLVLPRTCLKRISQLGIPQDRIIAPEPLRPFTVKGIPVEPVHAIHGNQDFTVLTREPDFAESITQNCGYVLNLGGKRLFHPGDSVLTEEHLGLKNIDVLFVSPTIHNMYTDRSMMLINRLQPAYILPQHFGTYTVTDENAFWTRGYPDELKLRLSADLQKRYHKLNQGQVFAIR